MISSRKQALIFILALFSCLSISLGSTTAGYLFAPDASTASAILTESEEELKYADNDLKNLMAHNLGVLEHDSDLTNAAKDAISKFGNKAMLKQQKINYLFLVESGSPNVLNPEKLSMSKLSIKHKNAIFNLCSGKDVNTCILDLLFDLGREESLVNMIKKATNKNKIEAYFYSSEPNTAYSYLESVLALKEDTRGNLIVHDNGSNQLFKLKANLSQCVNRIFDNQYTINVANRTITPITKNETVESIVFNEANEQEFIEFLSDLCSMSSISSLIRKDANPSFFTFYINSLGKLEALLTPEQSNELYNMFNFVYGKFVNNIQKYYRNDEISGQVFILNPEDSLGEKFEGEAAVKKQTLREDLAGRTSFMQGRVLQQTQDPDDDSTTIVIFNSVLIGFVLISLWIWIEMFQIEVQKDSIVYAKFLAADYFRR